jgi:hypothetical protein
MFSREIYDYIVKKYNDEPMAIITFSLYGKSIQYDKLKQIKYVGLTEGIGSSHIPENLYEHILEYAKKEKLNIKQRCKLYINASVCNRLGIPNISRHGVKRGAYLGFLGSKANDYLKALTDKCEPNYVLPLKDIFSEWKNKWGIKRFNHLMKTNSLMIKYKFNNCTCDNEYNNYMTKKSQAKSKSKNTNNNNKKNKNENKKKYLSLNDDEKRQIIKLRADNEDESINKFLETVFKTLGKKVTHKAMTRIIGH